MKTFNLIVTLLLALLLQSAVAAAQQVFEERQIITSASSKLMENILEEIDLEYEEIDNNTYVFKVKGEYKIVIHNRGNDIQLFAVFNVDRISLSRINEWNRTKRFTKAYLNSNNYPVIEADLDFEGGITAESIGRFFFLFIESVELFADEIQ